MSEVIASVYSVLISMSVVQAVCAWGAVYSLSRRNCHGSSRSAMMIWAIHLAAFWSTTVILRLFFDYVGPSHFMSTWAGIVFMHASLGIIFDVVVRKKARND